MGYVAGEALDFFPTKDFGTVISNFLFLLPWYIFLRSFVALLSLSLPFTCCTFC